MGSIYAGDQPRNYRNAIIKVGDSKDEKPAKRNSSLCREHTNWHMRYYISLYNETQNERRVVEADVRLALERAFRELIPFGNDHFKFLSNRLEYRQRADMYERFAMEAAIKSAEFHGIAHSEIKEAHFKTK